MPSIVVNGKTYSDPDEMPPEIRQAYEQAMGALADKNQNGIPDILEGLQQSENVSVQFPSLQVNSTQFIADGKVYTSMDDLPPEAREKYQQALAKMGQVMADANQNGVPDIFENVPRKQAETPTLTANPDLMQDSYAPVVSEVKPGGKGMRVAGIFIGVLLILVIILGAIVALPLFK
jgi:hypothetical protein